MEFFAEEERGVGIDEKQSITRRCISRSDGNAVRPGRLLIHIWFAKPRGHHSKGRGRRLAIESRPRIVRLAVERLEATKVHTFDISADTPFAERKSHPRLKAGEHSRLHFWMSVEVVVETAGPRIH